MRRITTGYRSTVSRNRLAQILEKIGNATARTSLRTGRSRNGASAQSCCELLSALAHKITAFRIHAVRCDSVFTDASTNSNWSLHGPN